MLSGLRNLFGQTLHYWRTFFTVIVSGMLVAALDNSPAPILLVTLGAAFVFSTYERRRWITIPANTVLAETLMRVSLAFGWTYLLIVADQARILQIG